MAEKSFLDKFKDGFKPMHERAKDSVKEQEASGGNQFKVDMAQSKQDRLKKIKKGFFDSNS